MITKKNKIWYNDFSPKSLDELYGNKKLISLIKSYVELSNTIPNIILSGECGTGKKTIATLITKHIIKNNDNLLIINGNVNKTKEIIITSSDYSENCDITTFAKMKSSDKDAIKICIIYNFDELTEEAQHGIRSISDLYYDKLKFILTTTKIKNIIESIQSRFNIFNIKPLKPAIMKKILIDIYQKNGFSTEKKDLLEILDKIIIISDGDIKKTINYLQYISYTENLDLEKFFNIFKIPMFSDIEYILDNSINLETCNNSYFKLNELFENGQNANDILQIMLKIIIEKNYPNKGKYLKKISNIYLKMNVMPSKLQLLNFIGKIHKL